MSLKQRESAYQAFLEDKKKFGHNESFVEKIFPTKVAKKKGQVTRPKTTRVRKFFN